MAKKISELTSATTLDGTELVPVVQGGVTKSTSITNLVSGGELPAYSTSETLTTERWTDGKPIYKKVVPHSFSTVGANNISSPIAGDIETLIDIEYIIEASDGNFSSSGGYYDGSASSNYYQLYVTSAHAIFARAEHSTWANMPFLATFRYTKTADTASSPVAGVTIAGGDSDWTEPTLTSSWQILSNDNQYRIEYRKDSAGVVHMRGLAQALDQNTVNVFTLPIGYRPAVVHSVATPSNTGGGTSVRLYIFSNGQVNIGAFASGTPAVANNSWASVSASFYADQ